jgi:hypothetical protein
MSTPFCLDSYIAEADDLIAELEALPRVDAEDDQADGLTPVTGVVPEVAPLPAAEHEADELIPQLEVLPEVAPLLDADHEADELVPQLGALPEVVPLPMPLPEVVPEVATLSRDPFPGPLLDAEHTGTDANWDACQLYANASMPTPTQCLDCARKLFNGVCWLIDFEIGPLCRPCGKAYLKAKPTSAMFRFTPGEMKAFQDMPLPRPIAASGASASVPSAPVAKAWAAAYPLRSITAYPLPYPLATATLTENRACQLVAKAGPPTQGPPPIEEAAASTPSRRWVYEDTLITDVSEGITRCNPSLAGNVYPWRMGPFAKKANAKVMEKVHMSLFINSLIKKVIKNRS